MEDEERVVCRMRKYKIRIDRDDMDIDTSIKSYSNIY